MFIYLAKIFFLFLAAWSITSTGGRTLCFYISLCLFVCYITKSVMNRFR